jgi:hypothetical protein
MSMTVKIALEGMTNVGYLVAALKDMGAKFPTKGDCRKPSPAPPFAEVEIYGHRVPIRRNAAGNLTLVIDSAWKRLRTESFRQKLQQNYSVAAVKHKVDQMGYHLSEIETLQDGTVKLIARGWR